MAILTWLVGSVLAPAVAQTVDLTALNAEIDKLFSERRFEKALPLAQQALSATESTTTPNDPAVADALMKLAGVLDELQRTAETEQMLARAVEIREDALGADHAQTGRALAMLSGALAAVKKEAEADAAWERALAIMERALGPNSVEIAEALIGRGALLASVDRREDEEAVLKRAVAIYAIARGAESGEVGDVLGYLGRNYLERKRFDLAEPILERSLNVIGKAYGQDHIKSGYAAHHLALVYEELTRFTDAVPYAVRSLEVAEKHFGFEHSDVDTAVAFLERIYRRIDAWPEAEKLALRSLAYNEKAHGPEDIRVASPVAALAEIYRHQSRYAEAEPLYLRAMAIVERTNGGESYDVAKLSNDLGLMYNSTRQHAKAETLLRRSNAILEKIKPDSVDLGRAKCNLGLIFISFDRWGDAEKQYVDGIAMMEKASGGGNFIIRDAYNILGSVYKTQRQYVKAEASYRKSLSVTEKMLGENSRAAGFYKGFLGRFLKSEGQIKESGPLLEHALEIAKKTSAPDSERVVDATIQLAEQYGLEGRVAEAEALFAAAGAATSADLKEFPIYFGTNRVQDAKQKRVAFGTGRNPQGLTLGEIKVIVPAEPSNPKSRAAQPSDGGLINQRQLSIQPTKIGTAASLVRVARNRLLAARSSIGQALVFVHGYNTSFDNAIRRAAQLAYDLNFDGPVFVFSWPSQESTLSYIGDRESAGLAAEPLREFLEQVVGETQAKRIHIIAHSMGSVALIEAVKAMEAADLAKLNLGELVLASPDLDTDVFQSAYKRLQRRGATSTVYAASTDRALGISSWLRNRPQLGYIPNGGPKSFVAGSDLIDISSVNSDVFSLNHDTYASSPAVIEDLRRLFKSGTRPPDARTDELKSVTANGGKYWQFVPPVPSRPKP